MMTNDNAKNIFTLIGLFCSLFAVVGIFLTVGCEQPHTIQAQETAAPPPNFRMEFVEVQPIDRWGQVCILKDKQTEQEFLVVATRCYGEGSPSVAVWPLMPGKAVNKEEKK